METVANKANLKLSDIPFVSRNISIVSSDFGVLPNNEELPLPLRIEGTFRNPWSSWRDKRLWDLLRWLVTTKDESNVPRNRSDLDRLLPIQRVSRDLLEKPLNEGQFRLTWLGHSSVLAQFDGFNILTDPVFSERCSPYTFIGPKRIRPVPCQIEDLPPLDVILVSHSHYDHLDKNTLKELLRAEKHRRAIIVAPLGVKNLLERLLVNTRLRQQIYELNWWEHLDVDSKLRIFLTPAQHWSKRTMWDTNRSLWGSFAVIGGSVRFYFAGDTGYCPVFRTIGRYLGPFDCAAIPIGAYHPRWFMSPQHIDPEQAVKIHTDIGSRFSIGVHWGTFILTNEYFLEPPQLVRNALIANKLPLSSFQTLKHGESTHGPLSQVEYA